MKAHPLIRSFGAVTLATALFSNGIGAQENNGSPSNNTNATQPAKQEEGSIFDNLGSDTDLPLNIKKTFREPERSTEKGSQFLSDQGHEFSVGVTGGVVYQMNDSAKDTVRGTVSVTLGYKIGPVAAALKLTPEQLISRALDDDFEKNGDTYTNGITTVNTKDIIEEGVVTLTIFRYVGEDGKEVFALAGTVGRDNATPLGSFVMEGWPAVSILEDRSLAQLDQIKVSATFMENTVIEIVNFGYDWFGYTVDPLKDIEQDGSNSYAINVSHKFDKLMGEGTALELYFSYADVADGLTYTRATPSEQPGENQTFAAGARMTWKKFTLATEGYFEQPNNNGLDDRYGLSAQAGYWIGRIQPVAGVELRDTGSATDYIYSLGLNWRALNNVMVSFLTQFVEPESGKSDVNFALGVSFGDSAPMANAKDTRSEAN